METHYFVPYEQSLELHKLGFKVKTLFGVYSHGSSFLKDGELSRPKDGRTLLDMIAAPTWEQAFEWICNTFKSDKYCLFLIPTYSTIVTNKLKAFNYILKHINKNKQNEIRNTN